MDAINQIFNVLAGDMRLNNAKVNIMWYLIRVIYLFLLLPSLIFVILLSARAGGAFGKEEKIGSVKRILLHIAMIFWSFVLWGVIINVILGVY